ncbi:5,10-methylenetetrahydromethanopterin reductase [uncultured archaeon]|nr:5,10-methylenetetrahydromethanopterin reductase [uncultured archaeon]
MHYGIEIVPLGPYSDPRSVLELAVAAEEAGWQGVWLWDHLLFPYGAGDPWISLAAVATATKKLKLCTGISPLPRYRPHLLARLLTGLDLLSQGRVIFGTGLGVSRDFIPFGETGSDKTRAEMADEGLDFLAALLSGKKFCHQGKFYTADDVHLIPIPVQRPHIPVWIGGESRAAMRRAARWDGWIMNTIDEQQNITKTPAKIAEDLAYILEHRSSSSPFDVAVDGISNPDDYSLVGEYEDAKATWWFESIFAMRGSHEKMLGRIRAGPPG